MTHAQIALLMGWQAIAPVAFAALCGVAYLWWVNRPHDDDDGDAPGLLVEMVERLPRIGFHSPQEKTA